MPPASAGGPASVRLSPPTSRVSFANGEFDLRVEVSGLDHHGSVGYDDDRDTVADRFEPSEGLGAFEVLLTFDPGVVEVVDVEAGDIFESSDRTAQCLERTPRRGQYAMGCITSGNADGPQGSGLLGTITLRPLANGTSYLALEGQLSGPYGDPIALTVAGGAVEVYSAPTDAPPPEPVVDDGDGNGGGPSVIGGGTPGDVDVPGDGGDPSGGPASGTGYMPDGSWAASLTGALAAAGVALLLAARLRLRPPR